MGKIEQPKKLRAEDFEEKDRSIISKLADVVNDLADSFYYSQIKSVDFDNLNRDLVQVNVNINGTGKVSNLPQVKFNLRSQPRGVNVVRAVNQNNPLIPPTNSPFVTWSLNSNGTMQILNVTGLPNNSQYVLTLEIIG